MLDNDFFTVLPEVDSTNNYAMAKIHAGLAKHGQAWFTQNQTAGKGQRGKIWQSQANQNIALSIAVKPFSLKTQEQFCLSMAIALGVHDFFAEFVPQNIKIKWPNDLYWCDRKAGGILIENNYSGKNWNWAVVGVGVNINQVEFNELLQEATSLKLITNKTYDVLELGKILYQKIMDRIETLEDVQKNNLLQEYNTHLYKKDEKVKLKKGNVVFETTIKMVDENGVLHTEDAMEREFGFGEVEWVR